ncbi:hypothetical protein [Ruminococcus flavefaciens]|uniref:hypothetical protein n=1 Tax=Ruminococcus flavefaciens TaxID=1265 RepID=UPI0012BC3F75|nr:hypothetical protein [Ruminococcus flavefaciens]
MKILKLIFLNIYKLFKESRSVLLFLLAGIIFASFGIFFYSGYFIYNYYDSNYSCELDINIGADKDADDLKSLIDKITKEKKLSRIVITDDSERDPNSPYIIGLYETDFNKRLFYGEGYQYNEEQPYVILSERAVEQLGFNRNITGEKINYNSVDYSVSGINNGMFDFCVSPYFYAENYNAKYLHAEFEAIVSSGLKKNLEKEGYQYEITKNNSPFKSPEFLFCLFIVVAVFALSFINILIMFSFWAIKMKQTFKVYYIYGCNAIKKFFIVSGQVFFISLFGTVLGFITFLSVYKKLGKLTIVYAESVTNYVLILILTILLLLLMSVYFGLKIAKTQEISFRTKE